METLNETNCLYELSSYQQGLLTNINTYLDFYGVITIASIGLFFNSITIVLLFDKDMAIVFFNLLLWHLAMFDNLYLLIGLFETFYWHVLSKTYFVDCLYYYLFYPVRNVLQSCVTYTTVLVALERHNLIANPVLHPVRENNRMTKIPWCRAAKYVAPVVLFSFIYHTPKFLEFNVEKIEPQNNCNITADIPILFSEFQNLYIQFLCTFKSIPFISYCFHYNCMILSC